MAAVVRQLPRLSRAATRAVVLAAVLAAALAAALVAAAPARATGVVLAGRMGDRALLVINGQPRLLSPGQVVQGVRLLRWVGERAEIDDGGTPRTLLPGTPVQVGDGAPPAPAREVVIPAGSGGHFSTLGSINGHAVTFLVDTGATMVSMGADEARRLGLDLSRARAGLTQTANGRVPVQIVVLDRVRVGDLELANVDAAILPLQMPQVLLGNSFLSRLQMQRSNDTLRLQLR